MYIKYTMKKYANLLADMGQVRLNTIWHFQADEKKEIGDVDEGQAGVLFKNDTDAPWHISVDQLDLAAMSSPGFPRHKHGETLQPGSESWIEAVGGFNTYMCSLTQADKPSKSLMAKLGYDAAVEIVDLDEFCSHTALALRQAGEKHWGFVTKGISRVRTFGGPVKYVDTKRRVITPSTIDQLDYTSDLDGRELFQKLGPFAYQQEYRVAYYFMNPDTDKTISLDRRVKPSAGPLLIHDDGSPRISKTVRLIDEAEFND